VSDRSRRQPAMFEFCKIGACLAIPGIVPEIPILRIVSPKTIHVGFVKYGADKRFVHIGCRVEGVPNDIDLCMTPFNH
jgi:hypothetical protein